MEKDVETGKAREFVAVVTCRDRVGIVRDITRRLGEWEANVESFSQTVLMNYFTLIFVVTFPQPHTVEETRRFLAGAGAAGEFEVGVKVYEPAARREPVLADCDRFVLTVSGPDKPGIIGQIAQFLASRGINITDLYAYKPDPANFLMISELALPRAISLAQVQLDIEQLGRRIGFSAGLQHENIFKATNEVAAPHSFK